MRRRREILLYSLAALMAIVGLPLIGVYGWSVWSVMGRADQSIIFWYAPFLLFGLILLSGAVTLFVLGWVMRRDNDGQGVRSRHSDRDDASR